MLTAVVAMQKEADALLLQAEVTRRYTLCGKQVTEGSAFGQPFALVLSGVGKSNAAAAAMLAVCALKAERLFNFGLAGGVSPRAEIGKVLAVERAVQYDFDLSELNKTPKGTLDEYDSPYFSLFCESAFEKAVLATGDRLNDSEADLPLLHALGADVRDMEGAALAHVARFTGTPLCAYKAVSNRAGATSVEEYLQNQTKALNALRQAMPQIVREAAHAAKM